MAWTNRGSSDSAEQFVEPFVQKLETIAGVTLANESTLIANLNNGSQTRAQVLRAVAESSEVTAKFYIQNFVTMQYMGHLRRARTRFEHAIAFLE